MREDQVAEMKSLLVSGKIKLPVDHVVTDDFANGKPKVIEGLISRTDSWGWTLGQPQSRLTAT